jgi:peptidoglycan/LPS O-acetylase OafA/YrhL
VTTRVPALDGVRGIAILLVLVAHLVPSVIGDAGWLGVDLFFVLSGYLITTVLLDGKANPDRVKIFYTRRALRIFPLYYGTLVLALVVPALFGIPFFSDTPDTLASTSHELAWFWPYLANWSIGLLRPTHPGVLSHFWSLCVEEQFYFVWPWVVWRCQETTARRVAWSAIIVAIALRVSLVLSHAPVLTVYNLTPCRMDALAIGALVALAPKTVVLRTIRWPAVMAAIALTAIALRFHGLRPTNAWVETIGFTSGDILGALLVVAALTYSPAALRSPILRWFGTYSYGLYVLHRFVIRGLEISGWDAGDPTFAVMAFGLSCVVAWISYNAYELPFLRLKDARPASPICSVEGRSSTF